MRLDKRSVVIGFVAGALISVGVITPTLLIPGNPQHLDRDVIPEPVQEPAIALPAPDDLRNVLQFAPTSSTQVTTREIFLDGQRMVVLEYFVKSQVASPAIGFDGGVTPSERQFVQIYRWDEHEWVCVFDVYEWAQGILNPLEVGPVTGRQPNAGTALIDTTLIPVPWQRDGIGDVLVVQMSPFLGPMSIPRPDRPTIAVLKWSNGQFWTSWKRTFNVRGGLFTAKAHADVLRISVEAYFRGDPLCCPKGLETWVLMADPPIKHALKEVGHITPPQR